MHALRLYINIDHVATIREARKTDEPDPVEAARVVEAAGGDGITVHLREDRRHIQDDDVRRLSETIQTVMNLELAMAEEIVRIAEDLEPFQATLVPEKRTEVTTEGGLDLGGDLGRLREVISRLTAVGARVSLFIDPELRTIDQAAKLGVPAIELHTGRYANDWRASVNPLNELRAAAAHARQLGLAVHAGHGLTYDNVIPVAAIREIEELNIGHSIVSRAVIGGMYAAVSEMRHLLDLARVDRT